MDLVFVLDCEESYLQQRLLQRGQQTERLDDNMKAIANRIIFFKEKTLPVIKHFDDVDKVVIVGLFSVCYDDEPYDEPYDYKKNL